MNHIDTQLVSCRSSKGNTPIERFWRRIIKSETCWIWTGGKKPVGYGNFEINGDTFLAHRISWVIHFGEIPEGKFVLHKCDNPSCVNPEHLFLGTQKTNMEDCDKKGRFCRTSNATLTKSKVLQIIRLKKSGIQSKQIAKRYGINPCTISRIINGHSWKHIHPKSSRHLLSGA